MRRRCAEARANGWLVARGAGTVRSAGVTSVAAVRAVSVGGAITAMGVRWVCAMSQRPPCPLSPRCRRAVPFSTFTVAGGANTAHDTHHNDEARNTSERNTERRGHRKGRGLWTAAAKKQQVKA